MGRKLGMTDEDIANLKVLRKDDFSHDEWMLLNHVREWTFNKGKDPEGTSIDSLGTSYSRKDIRFFYKLMNMMIFANYFSSRFLSGKTRVGEACPMPVFGDDPFEKDN